nr:unnamed protein product [Digitaria exilis]
MSWPPRPHAHAALVIELPVVAWSSPVRQVAQGFEEDEGRRGDRTEQSYHEFADDLMERRWIRRSYVRQRSTIEALGLPCGKDESN